MIRKALIGIAIVAGLVGTVMVAAPSVASAASRGSTYSFDLTTPNTALAPIGGMMASPGDWISVKGSGTFTPSSGTIRAGGTFVHYAADGTVHCSGTWKATALTSFLDFGTDENGEEGGVVSMVVTHYCKTMHMTMTGIPMMVTSTLLAPPGSSYMEGTTVADFTVPTGGTVVMQPEQ